MELTSATTSRAFSAPRPLGSNFLPLSENPSSIRINPDHVRIHALGFPRGSRLPLPRRSRSLIEILDPTSRSLPRYRCGGSGLGPRIRSRRTSASHIVGLHAPWRLAGAPTRRKNECPPRDSKATSRWRDRRKEMDPTDARVTACKRTSTGPTTCCTRLKAANERDAAAPWWLPSKGRNAGGWLEMRKSSQMRMLGAPSTAGSKWSL